ncbi:MAG: protein-L-isoaspartate(D-aspartate) O-methyltransferase [Desulfobacterales bacterium]|nr:protein-L-isoaspartate(D-aspartate) O-methyltransferase [Desulfobacterales bacterium]MBS3755875.1 protein-L-isoaspartate(D-aspartate) O-methyltransferase [Desulfobacterales bacterium]
MEGDSRRYQRQREAMVKNQIEARGVSDPKTLAAMRRVPRHLFVSEGLMDQAYNDHPLPIGEQQTISQPYIVAMMTEALQIDEDDRVLEIGTGSGYQAAVLAEIAHRVYTIERNRTLYQNARKVFENLGYFNIIARYSDGTIGWSEEAPFDAILITAGAPEIPKPLIDQLAMGGRMVIPVGSSLSQKMIKVVRDEQGIHQSELGGCRFVRLVGQYGWKES